MSEFETEVTGRARCSMRALWRGVLSAALAAAALVSLPQAAMATNCEITGADVVHGAAGVPEDVIVPIDPGGVRRALSRHGIELGGVYYGETFGNWGGIDQGVEYDGVLQLYLKADMHKLGLWKGLCFHTDGFQIHGNSITAANIESLMPVSNLEATDATRLFELWFEQHLFNDTLKVKVGQLAADAEFIIAEGGGHFLNGTWGWPSYTASDLPNGGPAYPLATPGVRLAVTPNDNLSLLVGLYNGDPAPQCNKAGGDPQRCNPHGLDFELDDPPLLMIEGQYSYSQEGLAGTVKIGGWNHFGNFPDQRFNVGGGLIGVTGLPGRNHDNDYGFYGIIDQLLWRVPGSEDPQGIAVFARVMGAPDDRNLVDFYTDAGVTFTGMIPNRPDDALAIGFAYTGISDQASAFDVDSGLTIARNYEALIEVAYTMHLMRGWTLQPDFQYIWQPGGNVPGFKDATVLGARSTISF